ENSFAAGDVRSEGVPKLNCPRPPLLERRVVQERIGVCVQNLVRELGRLRRIHRDCADTVIFDLLQNLLKTADVHHFMQTIFYRFLYERMIGDANGAGEILAAGNLVRKNRREQIVRPHTLYRRRDSRSAPESQDGKGASSIPSPARPE